MARLSSKAQRGRQILGMHTGAHTGYGAPIDFFLDELGRNAAEVLGSKDDPLYKELIIAKGIIKRSQPFGTIEPIRNVARAGVWILSGADINKDSPRNDMEALRNFPNNLNLLAEKARESAIKFPDKKFKLYVSSGTEDMDSNVYYSDEDRMAGANDYAQHCGWVAADIADTLNKPEVRIFMQESAEQNKSSQRQRG